MSDTFQKISALANEGEVKISEHGYDEMASDEISAREVIAGIHDAILIEDYPDYFKGPCVLVLQRDRKNKPIHVVWGIPKGHSFPAVLVTAYRPDPERWIHDFSRRRT